MDPNEALKALRANPTRETFDALDAWIMSGGYEAALNPTEDEEAE